MNRRSSPRRNRALPLLVAVLAAAFVLALRPDPGVGPSAIGQPPGAPADTPLALLATTGALNVVLPRAPAEPPVLAFPPQPSDDVAFVSERAAVARWLRGPNALPAASDSPAAGFASSRFPTGPPTLA